MIATEFTPISALIGGALIGLSAVLLMAGVGRIAGISGLVGRLFPPYKEPILAFCSACFLIGLIVSRPIVDWMVGHPAPLTLQGGVALLLVAGAFIGFGSVWGSGCTSGHGVCGLSRLSSRSFAAVGVFMAMAAITVFLLRHGI